jgi:O-antigen/teichoic acid export membrane protein
MTGPSERVRIARNISSSYGARAVLALSALLLTPYLYRQLGQGGFGTWSVMYTITTVWTLIEMGVSSGVTKFVAEFNAKRADAEIRATVHAGVILMALLGLLPLLISVAIGFLASGLAANGDEHAFRVGMTVLGVAMAVRFPFDAYGAALAGFQRYDLMNAATVVTLAGFPVAAIVAVEAGGGVLGVAIAYAGALAVGAVMYAILLRRAEPALQLVPRRGSQRMFRQVAGFSSFTLLSESMLYIAARMDTVVIAAVRNAATAAPYAAAQKLQSGLVALTQPFVMTLMPMVTDLWSRGLKSDAIRRVVIATRVSAQLTIPFSAVLALFATDITRLWLGDTAPSVTARIIVVLAIVQLIMLIVYPAEKALVGLGQVKVVGGLSVASGLSNLAVSIVLVSSYGAIGAALGTLFTTAVITPAVIPLVCRAMGASVRSFLAVGVVPAVLSSLPGLVAMGVVRATMAQGTARLAIGVFLGIGLSAAIALAQLGPGRVIGMLRSIRAEPPVVNEPAVG